MEVPYNVTHIHTTLKKPRGFYKLEVKQELKNLKIKNLTRDRG